MAVSADLPEHLAATMDDKQLGYTLLSDARGDAARAYGIGWRVQDELYDKMVSGYGIDLEKRSGQTHHELAVPSVFLVDTQGVIKFSYVNPDYRVRLPGDVLLAAAKSEAEG